MMRVHWLPPMLSAAALLSSTVAMAQPAPEEARRQITEQGYEVSIQGMAWSLNPPQPDLLRLFLAAGIPVDAPISFGDEAPTETPLQYVLGFACDSAETAEVVRVLVEAGSDPNQGMNSGYTMLGAAHNCPRVLEHLIAAGADLQARDSNGHSAMYNAILFGDVESVRVLVDAGFVPGDEYGDLAGMARHDAEKKALLDRANSGGGAPTQSPPRPAPTTLEQAIDRRDVDAVRQFVTSDGPTSIDDEPALVYLAGRCRGGDEVEVEVELIQTLLDAGANVNEREPLLGETALYRAAWHCPVEVVEALLAAGADPNARSANDQNPLCQAVFTDRPEVVEALLDAGATPDRNTKFFAKSKPEIQALLKKKR